MVCLEIICLAVPNSDPFHRPDQGPGGRCGPRAFNEGCPKTKWSTHSLNTGHLFQHPSSAEARRDEDVALGGCDGEP